MWLSAISKRTPQGYFIYFLIGLIMVFLPTIGFWQSVTSTSFIETGNFLLLVVPLVLLLLSILVNRVFVISDIFSRNTLWPGHVYMLLMLIHLTESSGVAIAVHGLLGILIMYEIITLQYNQDARRHCFQIGLYIGIASLFNSSLIFLAPFLLFGLRQLKPLNIKEYILFAIALGLPYYFVWSYSFLTDDFAFWNTLLPIHTWFTTPESLGWHDWTGWFVVVFAPVSLTMIMFSRYNSLSVRMRRLVSAAGYFLLGCEVVTHAGGLSTDILWYVAPIFALFSTMFMLRYSNKSTLEIIHLIFVGIIIGVLFTGSL